MTIKNKKIILFTTVILIILLSVIYFRIKLVKHWNTDPEAVCIRMGGFWDIVDNTTCNDLCSTNWNNYDCHDRRGRMGCWCGLDKCWDGKNCIDR
jgi:hypothetical protein